MPATPDEGKKGSRSPLRRRLAVVIFSIVFPALGTPGLAQSQTSPEAKKVEETIRHLQSVVLKNENKEGIERAWKEAWEAIKSLVEPCLKDLKPEARGEAENALSTVCPRPKVIWTMTASIATRRSSSP